MPSYMQYKRQLAALDADNSEIESWITVKGNHIPIMKGQSKEEAVKSFIESKGSEYKKESYGKYYVKYGEGENKKYVSPRNDLIYSDKSRAGFFGSEKEAKEYAKELNHTDPYAGTPFAIKNYKRTVLPYEVESEEEESKYDPEFETVRKNALANSSLYGGRYTQKSKAEAYREYKKDNMLNSFSKHYDDLYKNSDKDAQHGDLVKEFDKRLQSDPEFKKEVQEFVRQRGDVLSSDREVKAYMLAHNEINGNTQPNTPKKKSTKKKKEPAIVREGNVNWVDPKEWNSPANDPWYALYE